MSLKLLTFIHAVVVVASVSFVAAAVAGLPPNHPHADLLQQFGGQLQCPYADQWLTKGPEQAARDLGLISNHHNIQSSSSSNKHPSMRRQLQPGMPDSNATLTCELAPGPIGAAHQAAYSGGYLTDCPGTPAEGSPYMWPLRWTAQVEAKSMEYGSDDVTYHSVSQVYYRLDKNWKRSDSLYQRGIQRSIGQGPCPEENIVSMNGPVLACRRDSDQRKTMIHRGSQMFFISWINGTQGDAPENIEACTWLDLKVVGNIRPDWFLDDRGESTDTQYMGDQHVFYDGMPRLVKQWRKTDFADQYFTMSMLVNTGDDGIHWPMILNVPGEGFGDDFLQVYTNHSVLTEDDEELFLLDQSLEAIGGTCTMIETSGGVGPPTSEVDPVPSNLEIDHNAWISNVYTFSPIWEPPAESSDSEMDTKPDGRAITVADSAIIESCYDSSAGSVELIVTFQEVGEDSGAALPWMALGFRQDEECLMTPRGGGDSEIIFIASDLETDGIPTAYHGSLSPAAKSFDSSAFASIYSSLVALNETDGFSDVNVTVLPQKGVSPASLEDSSAVSVQLRFKQTFETAPEVMNLMYAIGSSPQLGYHSSRHCFKVEEFPLCPTSDVNEAEDTTEADNGTTEDLPTSSETSETMGTSGSTTLLASCKVIATALVLFSSTMV